MAVSSYAISTQSRGLTDVFTKICSRQSMRHVASSVFTKICMPVLAVTPLARRRYIVSQRELLLVMDKGAKEMGAAAGHDPARLLSIHCIATWQCLYEDLRGTHGCEFLCDLDTK